MTDATKLAILSQDMVRLQLMAVIDQEDHFNTAKMVIIANYPKVEQKILIPYSVIEDAIADYAKKLVAELELNGITGINDFLDKNIKGG